METMIHPGGPESLQIATYVGLVGALRILKGRVQGTG